LARVWESKNSRDWLSYMKYEYETFALLMTGVVAGISLILKIIRNEEKMNKD
jgi:hypothetical protein